MCAVMRRQYLPYAAKVSSVVHVAWYTRRGARGGVHAARMQSRFRTLSSSTGSLSNETRSAPEELRGRTSMAWSRLAGLVSRYCGDSGRMKTAPIKVIAAGIVDVPSKIRHRPGAIGVAYEIPAARSSPRVNEKPKTARDHARFMEGRNSTNIVKAEGATPPMPMPVHKRRTTSTAKFGAAAEQPPKIPKMHKYHMRTTRRPILSASTPAVSDPIRNPRKTTLPRTPSVCLRSTGS